MPAGGDDRLLVGQQVLLDVLAARAGSAGDAEPVTPRQTSEPTKAANEDAALPRASPAFCTIWADCSGAWIT